MKSFQYHTRPCGGARQGFSLLEMSIVLLIIAVVVGGSVTMLTGSVERRQFNETTNKLQVIQKTLLDYRRAYNRLPCPADLTLAQSSTSFGVEAAKTLATETNCNGESPSSNFFGATPIEAGMVPVRTLRLPDDYAFDGWGRRIVYSVDGRATVTDALLTTSSSAIDISNTTARISILDMNSTAKTTMAMYALVSYGPNGHGAYPRTGGSTRISTSSSNTQEQINCDCNASGVDTGANDYAQFVQRDSDLDPTDPANTFDDIVVSADRRALRNFDE